MKQLITKSENHKKLLETGNKNYDYRISQFNNWINGKTINMDTVKEYFDYLKDHFSPSTQRLSKVAIKKAIIHSGQIHDLKELFQLEEYFKTLKPGKDDKKVYKEKVLSKKELKTLIDTVNKSNPKIGLIIQILAITGLRISELVNIKLSDISLANNNAYIKILGKGRKERRVFVPLMLYQNALSFSPNTYLFETNQKSKYSRQYLHRIIKKYALDILNKDIHPHTFRHSFATHKIREKGSVKAVSNYLGHSTTAITETMYLHDELTPEDILDFI